MEDLAVASPGSDLILEQETTGSDDNDVSASCSASVKEENSTVRNGQFHSLRDVRLSRFGRPIRVPSRYRD